MKESSKPTFELAIEVPDIYFSCITPGLFSGEQYFQTFYIPLLISGVRFLDSYSMIPASDDDDGISTISSSSANPASNSQATAGQEAEVYNNIDRILATNKSVLAKTGAATGHQMATPPSNMQRRYSNESLVSNPAMLHTGAIVHAEDIATSANPTDSFIKPTQVTLFD